ncbi:hypothetical protein [Oceanobacillus locisalsi]|uniref:Uncharacterized protein n=1 Tax=Oceanobacillus locisalsi TaxID=546107 RepID=A0ABW3NG52_9BACI
MDTVEMYEEIETLQGEPSLTGEQVIRMKKLQSQLNYKRMNQEKINRILVKGQDMKQSEVLMLLEANVTRDQIRRALEMHKEEFREYLRNIGVKVRNRKSS